jgi:hypothetical protein
MIYPDTIWIDNCEWWPDQRYGDYEEYIRKDVHEAEVDRLKALLEKHDAAWDTLVERLDYAGEQYEHSDIVTVIAYLRQIAEDAP